MTIFSTKFLGREILLMLLITVFSNTLLLAQNEDKDGDGFTISEGDCDDYQPLVYPGANEIEDGQDNNCDGLIDRVVGNCDDFISPGVIGGGEVLCKEKLPTIIENITAPIGGTGEMQIMWIYTTDDPSLRPPEWYIIPNAHSLTYQPGNLTETTWFGRCVRRAGCWRFPNESNVIEKTVLLDCEEDACASFIANVGMTTFPDCDGNLGTTTINVFGGSMPYQFLWSDSMTTQNRTDLNGGDFNVTITDSSDCQIILTLDIPSPDCSPTVDCTIFSAKINRATAPDCIGNLGMIDVTVTNGVAPITYVWSDGDSTEDRTGLQGGNYQVTITDANGCSGTLEVNIPTPSCVPDCSTFAVSASSTSPDCEGNLGTIDVVVTNGVAPITYVWSDGDSTEDRTGLQGGNYQATITDANGCTGTLEVNIPTPSCVPDCSTFAVSASSTSPDCEGNLGTIDVVVTNGVAPITYVWSDGDSTEDRTGLQGGNYQATITDANGCTGTLEVNIPTPSCVPDCSTFAVSASSTSPDCEGNLGTIDVVVTNGVAPITYVWSDGDSTEDRTGLQGGNYQATITDANGCTGTLEVNIPTPSCVPDCSTFAVSASSTSPDCEGNLGTIDVVVTNGVAPITYVWSDGDSTEDRTGLQGGNYQATITDANGCTGTLEVNIPTPSCVPDCSTFAVSASSTSPDCEGNLGTIDVVVTNGVAPITYVWSDGDSTEDRTGLQGGNYQATITDANGCTGTLEVNIPTPSCVPDCSTFFAEITSTTAPDCDRNLGTIDISVINGVAPITYQWSDGDTMEDRSNLTGGFYDVRITDANGCGTMLTVGIPTPDCGLDCNAFTAQLIATTSPDCIGNLGSIEVSFINGVEPINYQWSDDTSVTSAMRTNLLGGNYEVTLTDANGCTDNLKIIIATPDCAVQCDSFNVQIDSIASPDCDGNLGSIDLSVENGIAPLTFAWQDGATTEDRTGLAGGSYRVTVSDGNACFQVVEIAVPTPDCSTTACENFIIPFTITNVTCEANSGEINLSAFGGIPPYLYEWADITENIEDRNNLTVGSYEVTVTDAQNCEKTASIIIGTADCVVALPPFDCQPTLYQIVEGQLNQVDLANDSLIPLGAEANNLNPLGYNVEDDFIYGIRFGTTDLIRIGGNGDREVVGRIQGINVGLLAGDFDLEGNYYLLDNEAQRLQRVDISAGVLVAATVELSETIPALGDVSYHPTNNLLYGASETSDIVSINPITGEVSSFNIATLPTGTIGSTWMTNKGEFIVSYNVSQEIYQIDLTNQSAVLIGNTGDSALNADGANCTQAASPLDSLSTTTPAFAFRNISSAMTDEMVSINYETVNETTNSFYLLEHSIDGNQFEVLPDLENAMGMPVYQYELQDQSPKLGSGYYRIKYIEAGGDYQYSKTIPVLFKQENTPHLIVHPNPFVNEMTINFIEPLSGDAKIMVSNSLGKIMETCFSKQGDNRLSINCPNYPAGFYTVYVKINGKRPIVYRTLKVE